MVAQGRGVLTMAYGSSRYLEMAKSLARPLILHSPDIPRAVVTDSGDGELRALFHVCVPLKRELGFGNRQKIHLDEYTPFRHERPYDEPLFAVAMALHGISAVPDEGTTMRTPSGIRGPLQIDVRRGVGRFTKYGAVVEPAVVHFAGAWARSFEYRRECYKLRHLDDKSGYSEGLALARLRVVAAWSVLFTKTRRHLRIRSRSSSVKKRC